MTLDRIEAIKALARQHPGRRSTAIIWELIHAIEEVQYLYVEALTFGWSDRRSSAIAFNRLKELATK